MNPPLLFLNKISNNSSEFFSLTIHSHPIQHCYQFNPAKCASRTFYSIILRLLHSYSPTINNCSTHSFVKSGDQSTICRRTSPRIKRNQWCNLPFRCVGGDHLQLSPNSDQLRIDLRSGGFRIERDPEEVLDNNRQTLGISSIESIVYLYPSQDYAKTRCQQKDNLYFGHHSLAD